MMNTLNDLYMTMNDNFRHHTVKTIIGLLILVSAIYIISLGSCNVWRTMHHESSYTAEEYNIHADAPSLHELHYAKQNKNNNGYKNQLKQQNKWRQLHIEQRTTNLNKMGLKHGVSKVSYNPRNHQLNVKFRNTQLTKAQQQYAQKLRDYVNQ